MLNCAACKQCYPVPRLRSWETCIQAAVCWPQHADGYLWEGDSSQHGVQRWVTASRDLGMSLDWCFSVFTLWLHHIPDVFCFWTNLCLSTLSWRQWWWSDFSCSCCLEHVSWPVSSWQEFAWRITVVRDMTSVSIRCFISKTSCVNAWSDLCNYITMSCLPHPVQLLHVIIIFRINVHKLHVSMAIFWWLVS